MLTPRRGAVYNHVLSISYFLQIISHGPVSKFAHPVAMLINGQSHAFPAAQKLNLLLFKPMQRIMTIPALFNVPILITQMMQI